MVQGIHCRPLGQRPGGRPAQELYRPTGGQFGAQGPEVRHQGATRLVNKQSWEGSESSAMNHAFLVYGYTFLLVSSLETQHDTA